jgi:hypothetical protein
MDPYRLLVDSVCARNRRAAALAGLGAWIVLGGACNSDVAAIGLVMRAPQGLLDQATAVTLRVADGAEVGCSPSGSMQGTPSEESLQSFSLDRGGCASGATWCKTITLDKDGSTKIFAVTATGAGGVMAEGCSTAVVDQDPLEVQVKVQRYAPPKCCGDGVLQVGEQCDPGAGAPGCAGELGLPGCPGMNADDVCDCDCVGKEILLPIDNGGAPNLTPGPARTKGELGLAFAGGAGNDYASGLRAVFTDIDTSSSLSAPDINLRLLDANLHAYGPPLPASASKQLRLPQCASMTTVNGPVNTQKTPAIAMVRSDVTTVVYASDQEQVLQFDVYLSAQLALPCAESLPVRVNVARDQSCEGPDVARGPDGGALVVWTDAGTLRGRIWSFDGVSAGTFTPADVDLVLGQATAGTARAAGWAAGAGGWVVAYEAGGNVWLETVSTTGAVGVPQQVNAVNEGAQPDVAALPDGRFVVVWRSGSQIFFQRFDAALQRVVGDQDQPLGVSSPPGWSPAGAFAAAWAADDGSVWARYLGGSSGFAYNGVTGQNDDFRASHPTIAGLRAKPAIAMGGAGWVAIGWQDDSDVHPGVFVRRFPLPQ